MIVGAVKETFPGERRVALVPSLIAALEKAGLAVQIEAGAGAEAGFTDEAYRKAGAEVVADRAAVIKAADILCQVRTIGANPEAGQSDLPLLRPGQTLIGLAEPLSALEPIKSLAGTGVRTFAMELMPRITRAQSMDVLSSQATIAGYKAVLLAAGSLPKMFPMLMTAAGTLSAAKAFIVGAGVAGLQAIATAKRLGAVVTAYDIRPAVKEQVESLGGKFLEINVDAEASEDKGGYAKAMDEAFYRKQQEEMARIVADSDIVITTAAVPGKKAPILVTTEMVRGMGPGTVIVDLAAERGGNCEPTRADEVVHENGVTILGPTNLPATVPTHASQMYARNVVELLKHLVKDGQLELNLEDEITSESLLTDGGEIVHARAREVFGLDEATERPSDQATKAAGEAG